jgi:hypothetical protein
MIVIALRAVLTTLRQLAHWVRYAGTGELVIDKMTDELERALAGERPHLPIHRYRSRLD